MSMMRHADEPDASPHDETARRAPRSRGLAAVRVAICAVVLALAPSAPAQSLDEVIDEERYLRGLTELKLPEVLDRYLELHPTDDAAAAMMRQQHRDRLLLRGTARPASERERIARRMMDRYEHLLDAHPDDPRRATWITDQAGDAYFEWMMIDASVWTALLGIAPRGELERLREAIERMVNATERAERIVLESIVQLEEKPGFESDLALQSQRRRLLDEHRDRRVPFFRGIALHLHARFNIDDTRLRRETAAQAAMTLNEVIPRLGGALQEQAIIHAGYARLLEGDTDRAATLFEQVSVDAAESTLLRFAAAVGESRLAEPRRGADAALRSLDRVASDLGVREQPYFLLLLADQRLILRTGSPREAYAAYLDVIDEQPDAHRELVRRMVLDRLAGHVDRFDRLDAAPPIVRIARSHEAARDPDRINQAINQLEELRERARMTQRESALAAIVLAQLYAASDRLEAAAATLLELVRAQPDHVDALPSLERALAHAADAYRADPAAGDPMLREALATLFDKFPQSANIDHWRMIAARLAINEDEFDSAIDHLERVGHDHRAWSEARFLLIEAVRRSARLAADPEPGYRRLLDRIDALERTLRQTPNEMPREQRLLLHVYRAEAHLALDDADSALETLDSMGGGSTDSFVDLPDTVIAEMLPIRIRAYEAIGRADLAGETVGRLVDAAPERAFDLLISMIDATEERVGRLMRQHRDDDARALAQRELLPLAKRLHRWHEEHGRDEQALMAGRRLADAYRYGGECETAMGWYERLLEEHRHALPLLLGRAECLYAASEDGRDPQLAEAMSIYRRIAATDAIRGDDAYWLSQVRMLQILDRAQRNTERILPRILQLRQIDSNLGGEYFRRQFEQLQAKHTP